MASGLLDEFGSIAALLSASQDLQSRTLGGRSDVAAFLRVVRAVLLETLRTDALSGPVLSHSQALVDYLRAGLAHAREEHFRVLFLDARNCLLRDATLCRGSVSEAAISPREIMRFALELGSTAVILVHNHPSGDPAPSRADIRATASVVQAGKVLDVAVHDHLIVARSGWSSFRALGLL